MFLKLIKPILIFFLLSNALLLTFSQKLQLLHIDSSIVIGINILLFVLTILVFLMLFMALKSTKANAAIHSIMLGVLLKFMVVAIATLIYAKTTTAVNKGAIYVGMFLYLIYTYIETKIALKINKSNGN